MTRFLENFAIPCRSKMIRWCRFRRERNIREHEILLYCWPKQFYIEIIEHSSIGPPLTGLEALCGLFTPRLYSFPMSGLFHHERSLLIRSWPELFTASIHM